MQGLIPSRQAMESGDTKEDTDKGPKEDTGGAVAETAGDAKAWFFVYFFDLKIKKVGLDC